MLRLPLPVFVLLLSFVFATPDIRAESDVGPRSRAEAIEIIAGLRRIVTPDGIERLEAVDINGTKQWISIRSRKSSNPVLLVVHGGPGWVAMPTSWYFAQGWEEYFTVVQWDQRGAGKSYDPALASTLSVDQMRRDLDAVIGWLRAETGISLSWPGSKSGHRYRSDHENLSGLGGWQFRSRSAPDACSITHPITTQPLTDFHGFFARMRCRAFTFPTLASAPAPASTQ